MAHLTPHSPSSQPAGHSAGRRAVAADRIDPFLDEPHNLAEDIRDDELTDLFLGPPAELTRADRSRPGRAATPGRAPSHSPLTRRAQPFSAALDPEPRPGPLHDPAAVTAWRPQLEAVLASPLGRAAGAWIRAYAAAMAQRSGQRVGLIEAHADHATLEWFAPTGAEAARPTSAPSIPADSPVTCLYELASICERLLFAGDEWALVNAAAKGDLDRVTLLTAPDDDEVVHAYRLIKDLARLIDADEQPEVTLSIVGHDHDRGHAAASRLRAACDRFIDLAVHLETGLERRTPPASRTLYAGPIPPVDDLIDLAKGPGVGSVPVPVPVPADPAPGPRAAQPDRSTLSARAAAPEAPATQTKAQPPALEPDLAQDPHAFVTIPGVDPTPIVHDAAPEVAIGVDLTGRLHLAPRHPGTLPTGPLLEAMHSTARWLLDCGSVLRFADPRIATPIDPAAGPVIHTLHHRLEAARAAAAAGYSARWRTTVATAMGPIEVDVPIA